MSPKTTIVEVTPQPATAETGPRAYDLAVRDRSLV